MTSWWRCFALANFLSLCVGQYLKENDPTFSTSRHNDDVICYKHSCSSNTRKGYGCYDSFCTYVCEDGICTGCSGSGSPLPLVNHDHLVSPWAPGGLDHHPCNGANCGYWNGCKDSICIGYYDFRGCNFSDCSSLSYRGYGCSEGQCSVICSGYHCHIPESYGMQLRKFRRIGTGLGQHVDDLDESFTDNDKWTLVDIDYQSVINLINALRSNVEEWAKVKPGSQELKALINRIRKMNRMKMRLQLWKDMQRISRLWPSPQYGGGVQQSAWLQTEQGPCTPF